jgi:hypothetical protein
MSTKLSVGKNTLETIKWKGKKQIGNIGNENLEH